MTEQMLEINQVLQHRLAEISEKNPLFSLRALARKIQVSPSHLSRVMRGEKKFSYQCTIRLARELDLSQKHTELILKNFEKNVVKKKKETLTQKDQRQQKILEFENFRLIADWYHFPILELIRTKGFVSSDAWIAKKLSLPIPVVNTALKRLESLGFISGQPSAIKLEHAEILKTPNDIQSIAIRKHHTQMLQKATEALEIQNISQREFQALNLNFNRKDINNAKAAIRKFTKDFNKKFSQKSGEDVYQLNLQFFSLTQEKS